MKNETVFHTGRIPSKENEFLFIRRRLEEAGVSIHDYHINVNGYKNYMRKALYADNIYPNVLPEKSLEHYVAATVLQLNEKDVYVDIASSGAPVADIYHRLYGCKTYRQDIVYEDGIHENRIGGNAAQLPLDSGFVSKMALHCSFEHFEDDNDILFIKEAERVLCPGGRLCILPLYVRWKNGIHTDPQTWPKQNYLNNYPEPVYLVDGYRCCFGRMYSVATLLERVIYNGHKMKFDLYCVENVKDIHSTCYLHFFLVFEKR